MAGQPCTSACPDVDPVAAERIHPNDAQRIQRALEVYAQTGVPLSELQQIRRRPHRLPFDFLRIGLVPDDRDSLK